MNISRRYLGFLLPFVARGQASSQTAATLPSKVFRFEDLPTRKTGSLVSRQVLKGLTHTGYLVDLHASELAAGQMPHPPHHHVHEEMLLIQEGQIEITISGKTTQMDSGSVAYLASGELHGWRNVGTSTAKYFVLALGEDKS